MSHKKRVLLSGGGSGGHIIPNLAVASELVRHGAELLYIGSRARLEARLITSRGIPFKSIFSGKLRRYFSWWNFIDPVFVIFGFFQAFYHVARFRPDVVFVKGGFVSLPVALAAFVLRRPIVLHESDSVMGLANRVTSRLAAKVCVAFPALLKGKDKQSGKFIFTGNPVRANLTGGDPQEGYRLTGFHPNRPILLVWGGSQGAREINEMVERHFHLLKRRFQIVHVTGAGKKTNIEDLSYRAFEYLEEELPPIYAITAYVVGRAGANSLYELALTRKPNILLPLQSSAHNHQVLNARFFEEAGASLVLSSPDKLPEILFALDENKALQGQMEAALGKIARPGAALMIADILLQF
ncbi:UDP-N-acetylglucosamine--N-acetylmuramyl-(pentapeptide) pyrophosphoryl-undecaprenol N-acetylglucosamine transferase [Candidatus Peregrinibacteria bacterium]|nr:UDP-N-acetylglucosamine--N-acetylmuramyl-(pentapeptide) pyrophosphoryl-undecaprenol N-acetylglucosamine transferase [Candidatus Peregrinibacteria bacterium]